MSDGTTPYRPRRALPSVVADDDFEDADAHGDQPSEGMAPRRSSGGYDTENVDQGSDPDWIAHQLNGDVGDDAPQADPGQHESAPGGTDIDEADATVLRPPAGDPHEQPTTYEQPTMYGNQGSAADAPYGQQAPAGGDGGVGDEATIPHRDVAMARPAEQERAAQPHQQPPSPRVEIPHAPTLQPAVPPAASQAPPRPTAPAPPYSAKRSAGRGGRTSRRSPSDRPTAGPHGARIGVVIGAVAATLVVVLAIGYAAFALNQRATVATQPTDPSVSSAAPSVEPETLSDQRLLTEGQAKALDGSATWAVAMTQTGIDESSPVATCLSKPTEAETPAEKTMIRTLSGTGQRTLSALHQADLYPTKDEAVGVFAERSKALGGCMADKAFLDSAVIVSDLSNQAIGVTVTLNGAEPQYHTVLMVQTGRILNVFDTATTDRAITQDQLATAAAGVVNTQCTTAIGLCADKPSVTQVVPPIGGGEPGLPVAADIPLLKGQTGRWAPADVTRAPTTTGTSCERYDFAKASGPTARLGRTYILEDDDKIPSTFGVDEVILTMRSDQDATKLADELRSNIRKCGDRQLTAKVSDETKFDSIGAQQTKIQGTSFKVQQKTSETETVDYRVTVNTAGAKVVYTFLPVDENADFTDEQWQDFNIRASQRATQIG